MNGLFSQVKGIHDQIPTDVIGGSSLEKCFIMAYVAQQLKLKTYVEIGVYKGKSLFSVTPAFVHNDGVCYGIDPWDRENLKESELPDHLKQIVDHCADTMDFTAVYQGVLDMKSRLGLDNQIVIIRDTAKDAVSSLYIKTGDWNNDAETNAVQIESESLNLSEFSIDMLHIDGNHDTDRVAEDINLYGPLVRNGGIVVFDDIDWPSVRGIYDKIKAQAYRVLLETDDFGILMKIDEAFDRDPSFVDYHLLKVKLPAILENVKWCKNAQEYISVFVGVMTYNSSSFIEECIRSILKQTGRFTLRIGIFDDGSTDNTIELVRQITNIPDHVSIEIYAAEQNEGYVKNYIRLFNELKRSDCDFMCCIDGDDYLLSSSCIQMRLDMMISHPECAVVFNRLLYYYQDKGRFESWDTQNRLSDNVYIARDLAQEYFIGNGSCSMVRRNAAMHVPMELYTYVKAGDWLTNVTYSLHGDIGYISDVMNVYRKHDGGVWSGTDKNIRVNMLADQLEKYEELTDYILYQDFYLQHIRMNCERDNGHSTKLVIVDDVFPHPVSGFRMEEYTQYLQHFENVRIYCNGASSHTLGKMMQWQIMSEFLKENPQYRENLRECNHPYNGAFAPREEAQLAYFCFLGNAFSGLEWVEQRQIPFVFELYPGGSFYLNDAQSDSMLRRVINSPYFRKVIVTQDVTYRYLIEKEFCKAEQIEMIFGVVVPSEKLKTKPCINLGQNCTVLRVCFAAMKYTRMGVDKGYDVFIEVVKQLAPQYNNIEFHVFGNFDANVISIGELEKRIVFHGILPNGELGALMQKMDIIVSPNRNNCITNGAFDGFPTATCTEAGLNGVWTICTDPLRLNNNRYHVGKEIDIVPPDVNCIVEKIEYYYCHRDELRQRIQNQYERIQVLYGQNTQIEPRIRLLQQEMDRAVYTKEEIRKKVDNGIVPMYSKHGRAFYSRYPDRFELMDAIEFEYFYYQNGKFCADISLEQIGDYTPYIWVYFINEKSTKMRFDKIVYGKKEYAPLAASDVAVDRRYLFKDPSPFIYLGLVKKNNGHVHMKIEGYIEYVDEKELYNQEPMKRIFQKKKVLQLLSKVQKKIYRVFN